MDQNDTEIHNNIHLQTIYIDELQSSLNKQICLLIQANIEKDEQIIQLSNSNETLLRKIVSDEMRENAYRKALDTTILAFMASTTVAFICIGFLAYNW